MKRRTFASSLASACALGAVPAAALVPKPTSRERLATRAEASGYRDGSDARDVARIFAELDARGAPIARGSVGLTYEGRDIAYVVASRPMVRTPAEAHALGRPIVLVRAALDGSDVEGTEAILAMVRDLCLSTQKTLLEEIVLLAIPLANVDASERLGPVATNAPDRNGPANVGARENAQGIDLTADHVRIAAPETRALLAFSNAWRPDAVIDLSCVGSEFDAFGATYAPPLHPAAFVTGPYVRDVMLPEVRKEMRESFGIETFSCGGFGRSRALLEPPSPGDADYGWFPGDYRPRIGANYMGVRGALAVIVSSYAHDPFDRRIFTTRASVEAILGFCSDNASRVRALAARGNVRASGASVPLAGVLDRTTNDVRTIAWENLTLDDGTARESGVPIGFRRTGTYDSASLPVYDRYLGAAYAVPPRAFVVGAAYARDIEPLLLAHGIAYRTAATSSLAGRPGDLVVPASQPIGPIVSLLLEPASEDGFAANVFGRLREAGAPAPILRFMGAT